MPNYKPISIVAMIAFLLIACQPIEATVPQPTATSAPQLTATSAPEPEASEVEAAPSEVVSAPTEAELAMPHEISLPPGFKIGVYASDIPNARSMVLRSRGNAVCWHA